MRNLLLAASPSFCRLSVISRGRVGCRWRRGWRGGRRWRGGWRGGRSGRRCSQGCSRRCRRCSRSGRRRSRERCRRRWRCRQEPSARSEALPVVWPARLAVSPEEPSAWSEALLGGVAGAVGGVAGTAGRAVGGTTGTIGQSVGTVGSTATSTSGFVGSFGGTRNFQLFAGFHHCRLRHHGKGGRWARRARSTRSSISPSRASIVASPGKSARCLSKLDRDLLRTIRSSCRQVLAAPRSFTRQHVQVCRIAAPSTRPLATLRPRPKHHEPVVASCLIARGATHDHAWEIRRRCGPGW